MGNMIVMPITKGMKIVMGIQVCLISWMNFDYKQNGGKKALFANPKLQYRVSQHGEHYCHPNNKKIDIIRSIQVSLISQTKFDYKENEVKKAFLANPKHQCHISQ